MDAQECTGHHSTPTCTSALSGKRQENSRGIPKPPPALRPQPLDPRAPASAALFSTTHSPPSTTSASPEHAGGPRCVESTCPPALATLPSPRRPRPVQNLHGSLQTGDAGDTHCHRASRTPATARITTPRDLGRSRLRARPGVTPRRLSRGES